MSALNVSYVNVKRCPKCAGTKPLTEFSVCRRRADGLQAYCKDCRKAAYHATTAADPGLLQRKRERWAERRATLMADPVALEAERLRGSAKQRRCIARKANDPAWLEKKRQENAVRYERRKADPAFVAAAVERVRSWRERRVSEDPAFAQVLREQFRLGMERWRRNPANRAKWSARQLTDRHKRRARLAAVPSETNPAARVAMIAFAAGRCAYCHELVAKLTLDHIVPLVLGGHDTTDNWAPACLSCNSSKGRRDPVVWATKRFGLVGAARVAALMQRRTG